MRVGAIREGAHNVFKQGQVVLGVKKFESSPLVFQQHLTNTMVNSEVIDQEIVEGTSAHSSFIFPPAV